MNGTLDVHSFFFIYYRVTISNGNDKLRVVIMLAEEKVVYYINRINKDKKTDEIKLKLYLF